MSRVIAGVLVLGLTLLVVGLFLGTSQWGVALVVVGAMLLAGFYFVVSVKAVRTKGFTWDVNPGAARREARREREAREREARQARDE
jgi:ABC-type transport system involved in cytochrome bd biosynthesis fused ATPase/permease subunit